MLLFSLFTSLPNPQNIQSRLDGISYLSSQISSCTSVMFFSAGGMFMSHQLFLMFLNERPLPNQVLGVYEICEALVFIIYQCN